MSDVLITAFEIAPHFHGVKYTSLTRKIAGKKTVHCFTFFQLKMGFSYPKKYTSEININAGNGKEKGHLVSQTSQFKHRELLNLSTL